MFLQEDLKGTPSDVVAARVDIWSYFVLGGQRVGKLLILLEAFTTSVPDAVSFQACWDGVIPSGPEDRRP